MPGPRCSKSIHALTEKGNQKAGLGCSRETLFIALAGHAHISALSVLLMGIGFLSGGSPARAGVAMVRVRIMARISANISLFI